MARSLKRVEIWSGLVSDGGSRLGFLSRASSAEVKEEVNAAPRLQFHLPRNDPSWAQVREDRVVRTVTSDGAGGEDFDEWRIRTWDKRREQGGGAVSRIVADGVRNDLVANAAMLERVEVTGQTLRHFEQYDLSPSEHMSIIMEAAPSYFSIGTVEFDEPVDMIYHFDTPLSALEELARVVDGEVNVRRNGTSGYLVDLVEEIGSGAQEVTVRRAGNLIDGSKKSDSSGVGTRIYPQGGNSFGREGSMADALWQVQGQSGATLTMVDPLIGEADQLNGYYVEDVDGDHHQIADSSAPRTITLSVSPGKALTGTFLRVKRQVGSTFAELSFLESPSGVANFGLKTAILERPDIPAVDNLVDNPFLRDWVGGLPVSWLQVGSPILLENVDPLYTRHGGRSAHVQGLQGSGLETRVIAVRPTRERPFFVAQIQLLVVSGHVRLELVDVTNGEVFPPEGVEAATIAQGEWIESFGVAPGGKPEDNFWTRNTRQMRIRVTATGGPAEFYLDAAQLSQNSSFEEVFYGGRASNDLWLLAKEALKKVTTPEESYRVGVLDRERLDPDQFPSEKITLGGPARVVDADLGIDFSTRVLSVTRDLETEGATRVVLEEKTNDLTKILGQTSRRNRKPLETAEGEELPEGDCTNLMAAGTDFGEFCSDDSAGDQIITRYPPISVVDAELEAGDDIAWSWDGKVDFTGSTGGNETGDGGSTGGETNPEGTLKRTTLGTFYYRPFAGNAFTLAVQAPELIVRSGTWTPTLDGLISNGDPAFLELDEAQVSWLPRADMVVQQTYRLLSTREKAQVWGRFSWGGGSVTGYAAEADADLGDMELEKWTSGTGVDLASDPKDPLAFQWRTQKIIHEGSVHRAYFSGEPVVELLAADGGIASGTAAWGSENAFNEGVLHKDLLVCQSNVITVNGLPSGWKVKTGVQVLADATAEDGAGQAVHDVGETMFALGGSVEVYTGADEFVTRLSPAGGIFGGDIYQLDTSAVEAPTDPGTGEPEPIAPGAAVSSGADAQAQHDVSLTIAAGEDYVLAAVTYEGGDHSADTLVIDPGGPDQASFTREVQSNVHGHASIWVLRGADVPAAGTYTVRLTTDGVGSGVLHAVPLANAADSAPEVLKLTSFLDRNLVSRELLTTADGTLLFDAIFHAEPSAVLTPDTGQTKLTEAGNPGAGMTGGTSYEIDAEAGEHAMGWLFDVNGSGDYVLAAIRPASAGALDDDSGFDISASLEMSFLDEDGLEILNTESFVEGVRTESYTRGQATTDVPEGTATIVPYSMRKGDAQGIACVRRPQLNRGTTPCDFREELLNPPSRVPTDQDLVCYYPCDEEGFVETYQTGWQNNESIVLSRRVWDASGRGNHGLIYGEDVDDFNPHLGLLQREARGASYLGLEHPPWYDDSIIHGQVILDTEPERSPTYYYDHDDFQQMADLTVCMWINPYLIDLGNGGWEVPNQAGDGEYLFGWYEGSSDFVDGGTGLQHRHAGFHFGLLDGVGVSTFEKERGFVMVSANGPTAGADGRTWHWPFDWTFAMEPVPYDYGGVYIHLLPQPIFVLLRISPVRGGTIDVDVFCGRADRAGLVQLSPQLNGTEINLGATQALQSAYGAPPIREHSDTDQASRWCWFGKHQREVNWDDGLSEDQGFIGRADELRRYNRALTNEEARGLFQNPSATTGIFRTADAIIRTASGSVATNPEVSGLRLPALSVDTCAGGGGLDVTAEWDPPVGVTAATHEIRIQYFEDGVANGAQYVGIDPEAGTHTHNVAGVGSDAGSPTFKDWHYEVELHEVGGGLIDSRTSAVKDISYGTC